MDPAPAPSPVVDPLPTLWPTRRNEIKNRISRTGLAHRQMGHDDVQPYEAPSAKCPEGHPLLCFVADDSYECDLCEALLEKGHCIKNCDTCDFSVCLQCRRKAAVATEQEKEDSPATTAGLSRRCMMYPDAATAKASDFTEGQKEGAR